MSPNELPAGQSGTVATQADGVLREAQALAAAMDRAKMTRRVLLLGFLAFVVISSISYYRLYAHVTGKQFMDELQSAASKHMDANSDKYVREVQRVAEKVGPVVRKAFVDRAEKDMPSYMKGIQREADIFVTNLQNDLPKKFDEYFKRSMEMNKAILEKDFPAAQDPEVQRKLVANLQVAMEGVVKKYYLPELEVTMQELLNTWRSIPAAPPADHEKLEKDFMAALMDLLGFWLTQGPPSK